MRVLHLGAGNMFGGVETLLVTLARERACSPEMVPEFGLCFEGRLSAELRAAGSVVHLLGKVRFSRPWSVWNARRRLGGILAETPPDAVITHACWPHSVFAPTVRRRKLPFYFWAHDLASPGHWLDRKASRWPPDRIVANSRHTASSLSKLFPGLPVEIIHPPVEPRAGDTTRRNVLRLEFDTDSDCVVVLMACRMEQWKGHQLLLQALALLKDVSGWMCWIAGGPQRDSEVVYEQSLRRLAAHIGIAKRVRFLGQRRDVSDLLAAADIYCQPNLGPEPFGIAFIEALNAGRPVITTSHGGALEIVNSDCGILVPPNQPNELARSIRQLIESPETRIRLGKAGPSRANALSDPVHCLRQLGRFISSGAAQR